VRSFAETSSVATTYKATSACTRRDNSWARRLCGGIFVRLFFSPFDPSARRFCSRAFFEGALFGLIWLSPWLVTTGELTDCLDGDICCREYTGCCVRVHVPMVRLLYMIVHDLMTTSNNVASLLREARLVRFDSRVCLSALATAAELQYRISHLSFLDHGGESRPSSTLNNVKENNKISLTLLHSLTYWWIQGDAEPTLYVERLRLSLVSPRQLC
jgi:hypothetical protein